MTVTSNKVNPTQSARRLSGGNVATAVVFADTHNVDAFGRLRVSDPYGMYESKHLYNIDDRRTWVQDVSGAGASITHLSNEAAVKLQVGTTSGEYAIIQTDQYFAYVPGRSQHILLTGVLTSGEENLVQRIGYFDDNNGLFFEINGTDIRVVRRTNTSGSIVDNATPQSNWNLDRLDGTESIYNPSGRTLDISKAQIFVIDFQWLGVGRIRYGFVIDGDPIYVHQEEVSNILTSVYMATPNLPIRAEIRNVGVTTSTNSIKQICTSVQSEGGAQIPGYEFSASNGVTTRSVSARLPVLVIRCKSTFNGIVNRIVSEIVSASVYTNNDIFFEIAHLHNPVVTGGTFVDVSTSDSSVQYNLGATSISSDAEHIIKGGYATAAVGTSKADVSSVEFANIITRHKLMYRNKANDNSTMFAVYATNIGAAANVSASLDWVELY